VRTHLARQERLEQHVAIFDVVSSSASWIKTLWPIRGCSQTPEQAGCGISKPAAASLWENDLARIAAVASAP
jgi:hypothetical protein